MSELIAFAQRELDAIGMTADDSDEMNAQTRRDILQLIERFSRQGHSGFSASYMVAILSKLLSYQPLSPLTGEDSEWTDVAEQSGYPLFQNKRCMSVFKSNEEAYDINGVVFYDLLKDDDGKTFSSYYTNGYRHPVTFPYTPSTEYRPRPEKQEFDVICDESNNPPSSSGVEVSV